MKLLAALVIGSCIGGMGSAQDKSAPVRVLDEQTKATISLRSKAEAITSKIGSLASSGKLPTSDESVKLLQQLVQELAMINEQLKKVQGEIEEIRGWMRVKDDKLPPLEKDVGNLKRITLGGYLQYQWSDTQEGFSRRLGDNSVARRTNNDGFQLRRVRLSNTTRIDPRTTARVSADFATGGNRLASELRDAYITHDVKSGLVGRAGQMPMPLGYELERSSSERELPERSIYNRTLMNGERNRGIMARYSVDPSTTLHAGLWNSLTVSDPQLSAANTFRNLSGTDLSFHVGARTKGANYDAGISGFFARRSRMAYTDFVSTASNATTTAFTEESDRALVYVDAAYTPTKDLAVRGELMFGRDRVPTLGTKRQTVGGSSATITNFPQFTEPTNVLGWQLQATYQFNYRNSLTARLEYFDPNTGTGGNDQMGLGLSYLYSINPNMKLMLAHEIFKERAFETRNNVTTIRLQVRL